MLKYRKIETADDKTIAKIIRANPEKFHLNIAGTHILTPNWSI